MNRNEVIPEGAQLVDVARRHGEQPGAPDMTVAIYRLLDGSTFEAEPFELKEGIRVVDGVPRLVVIDESEPAILD